MQPPDVTGPPDRDRDKLALAPHWYSGATAGQWLALLAALLGWMFDGFEQGVFPIVARPALKQFRDPEIRALPAAEQPAARAGIDEWVRRWNAVVTAAFLRGAA